MFAMSTIGMIRNLKITTTKIECIKEPMDGNAPWSLLQCVARSKIKHVIEKIKQWLHLNSQIVQVVEDAFLFIMLFTKNLDVLFSTCD